MFWHKCFLIEKMYDAICTSKFVFLLVFHTDQDDPSSSDDEGMPYTRPVKFKAAHGFKGPYDFEQIKVVQDLSGEHMVCLKFLLWLFFISSDDLQK